MNLPVRWIRGATNLMELLDELNRQGTTIIISTHDVELAYLWADQIILMNKGTVLSYRLS